MTSEPLKPRPLDVLSEEPSTTMQNQNTRNNAECHDGPCRRAHFIPCQAKSTEDESQAAEGGVHDHSYEQTRASDRLGGGTINWGLYHSSKKLGQAALVGEFQSLEEQGGKCTLSCSSWMHHSFC